MISTRALRERMPQCPPWERMGIFKGRIESIRFIHPNGLKRGEPLKACEKIDFKGGRIWLLSLIWKNARGAGHVQKAVR